ncbi:D-methionine transport system ATP-binding protein [Streptohalobacillus salinus]|uniref:D-methionine transport system ATP-binding protein n=1 Tax=Streptohalobacillus salinus TaxID=621096 RepID=A0A2V3WRT7_9BACI|nr:methionine ABC transporter ATP-binding protein [Streptohalobacillus salinus]PXW91419.1 D-methionine transport system ATP-binding protein [Streptohalobacillus salinus]
MIVIDQLSKIFKTASSELVAVDQLSLSIEKGEIFGVIGYSGAGKSTFIRLINRLEEPTSGRVEIEGELITGLSKNALRVKRQNIGMIFQHFNLLWSRTVSENIAFPLEIAGVSKEEIEKRVQELVDLVGLSGKETSYPSQLSGGQKQRVGIARALANRPKVLLCDEATSALDPETTDSILALLVDINKQLGLTIILITHEMHVIQKICHNVAVMEAGRIVEQGSVLDVFSHPKKNVTKKFVEQVMGKPDDEVAEDSFIATVAEGHVLKLQFIKENTNQALISEVAKKFKVDVNILQGNIKRTQEGAYGSLYVQMVGEEVTVQEAIQYIEQTSVEVEVITHD